MRVAVLDLGTNTFNLVVAEQSDQGIRLIHSSKHPVKLGEGGINKGIISSAAFERGITAIEKHYQTLTDLGARTIRALGTSALRTASNGKDFLDTIQSRTGIRVEIIDGDREAELIYYGVRETFDMSKDKYLILDIGGGSNEFIIANDQEIFWKKSYKLGIARLLEQFNPSDPIYGCEIQAIRAYLEKETLDLAEQVKKHGVSILLGASGSFETFAAMIRKDGWNTITETALAPEVFKIEQADFDALYEKLIASTLAERKGMEGLEPMRIEMIVLACLFVKFILEKLEIREVYQTNYSLKEGVIYQLFKM